MCRMSRAVQARRAIPAGYLALGSRPSSHSIREFQERTLRLDCKKIPSRSMSPVSELVQFRDLRRLLMEYRAVLLWVAPVVLLACTASLVRSQTVPLPPPTKETAPPVTKDTAPAPKQVPPSTQPAQPQAGKCASSSPWTSHASRGHARADGEGPRCSDETGHAGAREPEPYADDRRHAQTGDWRRIPRDISRKSSHGNSRRRTSRPTDTPATSSRSVPTSAGW
jgi:hypothetical protein